MKDSKIMSKCISVRMHTWCLLVFEINHFYCIQYAHHFHVVNVFAPLVDKHVQSIFIFSFPIAILIKQHIFWVIKTDVTFYELGRD